MKTGRILWQLLTFGVLLSATSWLSASERSMGSVEIRLTDHQAGIADFASLHVSVESISLHQAGESRNKGWRKISGTSTPVDIVPLKDGIYTTLGTALIPARVYDAVSIRFAELENKLLNGGSADLEARNTVVATSLDLRKHKYLVLVIDLYAENQTDHQPRSYKVKVKEVRIEQ